jgi:choline dehydrogenase
MINIPSAPGVKLALLEAQLLSGEIDRSAFLERTSQLGLAGPDAGSVADKFLAIAANQAARRENLKASYDYIVIGSGAAGSVVARRLAENRETQVLLLEAGGEDLKPNVLITENWYFNQGGPMDWNFMAEPSAAVNNRSIHQAMGKAFGGGTSINGMVWARGHQNDFNYWAKESGDECWGYAHILEIYKGIEDWHPHSSRRPRGSESQPLRIRAGSSRRVRAAAPLPMFAFAMAAGSISRRPTCTRSWISLTSRF